MKTAAPFLFALGYALVGCGLTLLFDSVVLIDPSTEEAWIVLIAGLVLSTLGTWAWRRVKS